VPDPSRETRAPASPVSRRLVYGLTLFSLATIPGAPGLFPLVSHAFGDSDMFALGALGLLYVVGVPVAGSLLLRRRRTQGPAGPPALLEWIALGWLTLVLLASVGFFVLAFYVFSGWGRAHWPM
jgi:hypothetical protein